MLGRGKKETRSNELPIPESAATSLVVRSIDLFQKIAGLLFLSKKPRSVVSLKEPNPPLVVGPPSGAEKPCLGFPAKQSDKRTERPEFPARCIVFSDTENDVSSVRNTLRFVGILKKKGDLRDNLEGITIFHTGDLIDKKNPDPSVVEYWQFLQQGALAKGARVKLIVGNHEQKIWQKIRAGDKMGIEAKKVARLNAFIESLDLFYVAGPVLFIHGYPTLEFLQTLLHFKEATGKDLNCFNADHYRKAFRSVEAMRQYAYVRDKRRINYLLYDVADASRYYRKQGRMVSAVLRQLKIDVVVHGHRPQRSGVQVDYEFRKWIPNVRMTGNDTMVKRRGIGATVIKRTSNGALDMVFINTKTESKNLRSKVRKDFREAAIVAPASRFANPEYTDIKAAARG
jgi:hypothetical protein